MRKILVLAALVGVLGATEARAQDRGGVRFGYNAATLSVDDTEGFDVKTRHGFVAGFFGVVPVNSLFAVQPEFLYSQQGARVSDGSDEATLKIDYINIPVLARIRLGSGSPAHLLVGPSFGFRTRAESKIGDETMDFKDEIEGNDIGFVTGVAVNAGMFVVDGRYTWGLKNIAKSDPEAKNRVFSLSAGVRF